MNDQRSLLHTCILYADLSLVKAVYELVHPHETVTQFTVAGSLVVEELVEMKTES